LKQEENGFKKSTKIASTLNIMGDTHRWTHRLQRELAESGSLPYNLALEDTTLYFVLHGQVGTPFEQGYYFGKIDLGSLYPFTRRTIYLFTPNGRTTPGSSVMECELEDCPAITIDKMMVNLNNYLVETFDSHTLRSSDDELRILARNSLNWNYSNSLFPKVFGHTIEYSRANHQDLFKNTIWEELTAKAWHPDRLEGWLEAGFDPDD
jgi:hypothetical protein